MLGGTVQGFAVQLEDEKCCDDDRSQENSVCFPRFVLFRAMKIVPGLTQQHRPKRIKLHVQVHVLPLNSKEQFRGHRAGCATTSFV